METHYRQEIARLLALDEDDLYRELALSISEVSAIMHSYGMLVGLGKETFAGLRDALYTSICVKSTLCRTIDEPQYNDAVTLVATVADLISSSVIGLPVPAAILATLLVRMGIRTFCADEASGKNPGGRCGH